MNLPAKAIDITIRHRMPFAIATAWRRVSLASDGADQRKKLENAAEVLLRTVAAPLLADYLCGPRDIEADTAIRRLKRPSMGHWVEVIRECVRAIEARSAPAVFLPEAIEWYRKSRESRVPEVLGKLIEARNKLVHNAKTEAEEERWALAIKRHLYWLMASLGWLCAYRPLRVLKSKPTTQRTFTGQVQFLVGSHELSDVRETSWSAWLLTDHVYLVSPEGDRFLDLSKFMAVARSGDAGTEQCFLLESIPHLRRARLLHDGTNASVERDFSHEDTVVPFEQWLEQRGELELALANANMDEVLVYLDSGARDGETIDDRYVVQREIGGTFVSRVFRVRDLNHDQDAVLIVIDRDLSSHEGLHRLTAERWKKMVNIQHPNLLRLEEIGQLPDRRLFARMPWMPGRSLKRRKRRGGLDDEPVAALAIDVLSALAALHAEQIVHGDVRPGNLLFDQDDRVLLAGPRIPLAEGDVADPGLQIVLQDAPYSAPEHRQGPVSAKSDVYSLAVVMHELRRGSLPKRQPGSGISGHLGALLRRMGAADPDDRPTASQAEEELRTHFRRPEGGLAPTLPFERIEPSVRKPFRGLQVYRDEHESLFFGRDDDAKEMVRLLQEGVRWLHIEGASGVGKSSLLFAKVLPQLQREAGERPCFVLQMRPRTLAVRELAQACLAFDERQDSGTDRLASYERRLRAGSHALANLVRERGEERGVLLVVDQLEELFTLNVRGERRAFGELVGEALADTGGTLQVATTIRSDFLHHLHGDPQWAEALERWAKRRMVAPLTGDALQVVIEGPLEAAGGAAESEDLVGLVVAEAEAGPGRLPLLSHALSVMWEKTVERGDLRLTLADYQEIGGIGKAVTQSASEILRTFSEEEILVARRILLDLVQVGRSARDIRRTRTLQQVLDAAGSEIAPIEKEKVLGKLSGSRPEHAHGEDYPSMRLVVVDGDRVDLVHDSLIEEWKETEDGAAPGLHTWVEEARRDLERRDDLDKLCDSWIKSGRSVDLLMNSGQLRYFTRWSTEPPELSKEAREFVAAAQDKQSRVEEARLEQQGREDRARLEQQKREEEARRREERVRRRLYARLAVTFFLVAVALSVVSMWAWNERAKANSSLLSATKQRRLTAVKEQAVRMDLNFSGYESLVHGLAGTTEFALTHSSVTTGCVYLEREGVDDHATKYCPANNEWDDEPPLPPFRDIRLARRFAENRFGTRVSWSWPSARLAPGVKLDNNEPILTRLAQLSNLRDTLLVTLLRSRHPRTPLEPREEQERLVLDAIDAGEELPFLYSYLGTKEGIMYGLPGGDYLGSDDYDPREQDWYVTARGEYEAVWRPSKSVTQRVPFLMTCSMAVRRQLLGPPGDDSVLAVVAVDLPYQRTVTKYLVEGKEAFRNEDVEILLFPKAMIDETAQGSHFLITWPLEEENGKKVPPQEDPIPRLTSRLNELLEEEGRSELLKRIGSTTEQDNHYYEAPNSAFATWSVVETTTWIYLVVGRE